MIVSVIMAVALSQAAPEEAPVTAQGDEAAAPIVIADARDHWALRVCDGDFAQPSCSTFTKLVEFGTGTVEVPAAGNAANDRDAGNVDGGGDFTASDLPHDGDPASRIGDLGSLRRPVINKSGRGSVVIRPSRRQWARSSYAPRCVALGRDGVRASADRAIRSAFSGNQLLFGDPLRSDDRLTFIGQPQGKNNVSYVVRIRLDSFSVDSEQPRCGVLAETLRVERVQPSGTRPSLDSITQDIYNRLIQALAADLA